MARPAGENTYQVAFKIPPTWAQLADTIAEALSRPGVKITRTDALRAALWRGLETMNKELKPAKRRG